ncbi:MAG: ORF6N domain-containing protein [Cytophagales bacterium]|nr:ORF6N domain-containing protein [Cytophagales bacterium]
MSSIIIDTSSLTAKIYYVRGERVLLDMDLAILYGVEAKRLKEAVRRNNSRFPGDFLFRLSTAEWSALRTQFATFKVRGRRLPKYAPYAFTEQGVAMLSGILTSPMGKTDNR